MLLQPTAKAHLELERHPGVQILALRERSLLLLAGARRPAAELGRLFNGMGEQIMLDLVRQGYLALPGECRPATADQSSSGL